MNSVFDIIRNLPYQHLVFTFISIIIVIIFIYIYIYSKKKYRLLNLFSLIAVLNELIFQILLVHNDKWSFNESLPLEMCYISALIIPIYNYNKKNRNLKNWLLFAGFGGSFFAFINTNLVFDTEVYTYIHYFIAHGLIPIVVATFIIDGYRPSWKDYFIAVKWTFALVFLMCILNYFTDSNYMFTKKKPPGVTFTQLMPEWPYYYFIMIIMGLITYSLLMLVRLIPSKNKNGKKSI